MYFFQLVIVFIHLKLTSVLVITLGYFKKKCSEIVQDIHLL
jgi:hypothetical protein